MSKKKLFVMMALVIVIAVLGTGTLAYFTTKAVVHNVITTGGVGITLEETMRDENGDEIPYENPDGVMPGDPVSKIVRVKNDDADAWIRVRVDMRVETPRDEMDPGEDIILDYNAEDWTYHEGWYYYNEILPSGQRTTPLFEEVSLSGEGMGNEYQNSTIYIDVKAQAVQSANNGTSVLTATGWPD